MQRFVSALSALAVVLFLLGATAAAAVVIFTDGTRMQVQKYEIEKKVVVITTMDGKLRSIPSNYINLDATQRLNPPRQSQQAEQAEQAEQAQLRRNQLGRPLPRTRKRLSSPCVQSRVQTRLRHPDGPFRKFRRATFHLRFGRTTNWA